jgi:murein DD-endopeptidase MepM/ murein hydrolase activator NlpD
MVHFWGSSHAAAVASLMLAGLTVAACGGTEIPAAPSPSTFATAAVDTQTLLALRTVVDDRLPTTPTPAVSFTSFLVSAGVSAEDAAAATRDLKAVLDQRTSQRGGRVVLDVEAGNLQSLRFHTSTKDGVPRVVRAYRMPEPPTDQALLDPVRTAFVVAIEDATVEIEVTGVIADIDANVYTSILNAGEKPQLVDKFVDVFAWNIDFYRQTQRGDSLKILVEKRFAGKGDERKFLGYGTVMAAEYKNGSNTLRGFAFQSKDASQKGHFDEKGQTLERTFLKSPMEITRITSHFGMRFHPIQKHNKKHEGIDYGAPSGTPVWTVADGVVREARYAGSAGNMVLIEHANGLSTEYFHLSRFGDGMRPGVRVTQRQIVGYVGSTGASTGPHLHFGMRKRGEHVDPSRQAVGEPKPLPPDYKDEFDAWLMPWMAQLEALGRA